MNAGSALAANISQFHALLSMIEIWDFKDGVEPITNVADQYLERLNSIGPSTVECELAEDLYLCTAVFFNFIQWRMGELKRKDEDLSKQISDTQETLKKMAAKNSRKLKQFGLQAERNESFHGLVENGPVERPHVVDEPVAGFPAKSGALRYAREPGDEG